MQIFSCTRDQIVVRMVALEIDGPHITLSASNVHHAILVLTALHAADKAIPATLQNLVHNKLFAEGCRWEKEAGVFVGPWLFKSTQPESISKANVVILLVKLPLQAYNSLVAGACALGRTSTSLTH
jgi:hypothetical protein